MKRSLLTSRQNNKSKSKPKKRLDKSNGLPKSVGNENMFSPKTIDYQEYKNGSTKYKNRNSKKVEKICW